MNADGWGVGWWDPTVRPEPARYRTAAPMWTDRSFRSVAERGARRGHRWPRCAAPRRRRRSSTPATRRSRPGPWLFSLNGFVVGLPRAGRRAAAPHGDRGAGRSASRAPADTEVLFALVLDRLDAGASPAGGAGPASPPTVARRRRRQAQPAARATATPSPPPPAATRSSPSATPGLAAGGVLVASEPLDDDPGWDARCPTARVVPRHAATDVDVLPLSSHGGPP